MSRVAIRAALETALDSLPDIIPVATIATSVGGVFTTTSNHGLEVGLNVEIANHTGTNGVYEVASVLTSTSFTLVDYVSKLPVASDGINGTARAQLTAWENMYFPVLANRVPYQKTQLMPAKPDNPTMGSAFHRELGIYQVTLVYPLQLGAGDAEARAELIKSAFPRGASFSNSGIEVKIDETPEIMGGMPVDEGYQVPVRISYYADIFN